MDNQLNDEPRELMLLEGAKTAIMEANTVDEVRDLRNKAQAIRAYVRKAQLGRNILLDAAAIKLRAERRLGEMLQSLPLANFAPGNQYTETSEDKSDDAVRLQDVGISKSESSKLQKIARLPEPEFEHYIDEHVQNELEPTLAGCLRLVKTVEKNGERSTVSTTPEVHSQNVVTDLAELIREGSRFPTIYANPPWPDTNQPTHAATGNHSSTLSIDELCDEPVPELCKENAHLHLWTTNAFLLDAFDVLEAWGFTYKSCFIWVKPTTGQGQYWRLSHEFLLLGVKGKLPFADHSIRSWQEIKRTRQSEKPEVVRELIERASPGPYLELYSRQKPANGLWTVYDHETQ